jgi:ribosomal-protein-alanine N-acetyltransferase
LSSHRAGRLALLAARRPAYDSGRDFDLGLNTTNTTALAFGIRDYRATDFDRLWEIDQRCFPSGISYTQMELSGFITRRNAITLVGEFHSGEDADVASAEENPVARIAGFVVAHPIRRKYGRILTLDILAEARRYGLGIKLMTACEERLRAQGCADVYLETAVDNEPAIQLYSKLGYQILRTIPDYYASHSLDAFQMRKHLNSAHPL